MGNPHRSVVTGKFLPKPGAAKQRAQMAEYVYSRRISGIAQSIRQQLAKQLGIGVRDIPFSARLQIESIARCKARMEVIEAQVSAGLIACPDEQYTRLLLAQRRSLRDIGLHDTALDPPPKPRPAPPLSSLLRQQAGVR
jgi:hypothetical protein